MKKPRMLLVTHSFPYGEAEKTFLAPEVKYLEKYFNLSVVSRNLNDEQTTLLDNDTRIYRYNPKENYNSVFLMIKTLFARDFWKECFYLVKHKKIDVFCFKQALSIYMRAIHFSKYLKGAVDNDDNEPMVFYTYWNGYETYACKKIKNKKDVVITRTHGGDLYLKIDNHNYQPYKNLMNRDINRIYFVSQDGMSYYKETFDKLDESQYALSRLGTFSHGFRNALENNDGIIRIFTLSRLFWVKRIDKLIQTLSEIDDLQIEWTHIGDGELHDEIYAKAKEMLDGKSNIAYKFMGNLNNDDVFEFLKDNPMDFIVNTSYSEGLPVSIIEAMSCEIPAIAVNVGGIPEIVCDSETGYLINRDFTSEEFRSALVRYAMLNDKGKQEMRNNAFKIWDEKFNADNNHHGFAEDVIALIGDQNENNK